MASPSLLTLNIGSSSIKYAVFALDTLTLQDKGKIDCTPDTSETHLDALVQKLPTPDHVAHRIVHGGESFTSPCLLDERKLDQLESFIPFAPLHQPHNINGVRLLRHLLPGIPQYGCFDTEFHAGHDALHSCFALPEDLRCKGLKRYGFHGISYEWIARKFPAGRVIAAHLGSGSSLCAIKDGKSIDTTMGLTALDGLPMSTRCGAIDAGLILYLSRNLGYSAADIETLLYTKSGLAGLSGRTGDVKTLLDLSATDKQARFAIDYFIFKTAQFMAMMAVSLGGVDRLVFTGGIGENAPVIRDGITKYLSFLAIPDIQIIPTDEEQMMAIKMQEILSHA